MRNKLMIMMIVVSFSTPTFADFTLKDLFVSGGTDKPTETQEKKQCKKNCN